MNKIIALSVVTKTPVGLIRYVQYSTEIPLEFCITDYPIPAHAVGNLYIKKPSGLEAYNAGEIVGNSVVVHPTAQLFAETGEQEGQLQIAADGKILVSFLLCFDIEKNIIENSAIESTNEYTALDKLITEAKQAIPDAQNAAEAANSAASEATRAAGSANTAAGAANTAAGRANSAAGSANTAAGVANTAAGRANSAAKEAEDIIGQLKEPYPVNSLYFSTSSQNPSAYFGGTWALWGKGRMLVGVDPDDSDFDNANKTGGEKTHTLTATEMPAHTHTPTAGGRYMGVNDGNLSAWHIEGNADWGKAGTLTSTTSAGGNEAHNNMPPYITCYMWRRTA